MPLYAVPTWTDLMADAGREGIKTVAAAGVVEFQGDVLLLRRNGRWDVPRCTPPAAGDSEDALRRAAEQATGLEVGGLSYYLGYFDTSSPDGSVTRTCAFTFWFEHQKWGVPPLWALNPGDRWQDKARVQLVS